MGKKTIAVVDYGMGNIHSIIKALLLYHDDVVYSADPQILREARALILPGDGAFGAAMNHLQNGLEDIVRSHVESGRALLGVCIGFQILFEDSDEGAGANPIHGLGLIPGRIRRFQFEDPGLCVPHMGWNQLQSNRGCVREFSGEYMYFIHSYRAIDVPEKYVLAECEYGPVSFPAIVQRDNIFATQFHPEKSHSAGLRILEDWVSAL